MIVGQVRISPLQETRRGEENVGWTVENAGMRDGAAPSIGHHDAAAVGVVALGGDGEAVVAHQSIWNLIF